MKKQSGILFGYTIWNESRGKYFKTWKIDNNLLPPPKRAPIFDSLSDFRSCFFFFSDSIVLFRAIVSGFRRTVRLISDAWCRFGTLAVNCGRLRLISNGSF